MEIEGRKSIKWFLTIGTNAGYSKRNTERLAFSIMAGIVSEVAHQVMSSTGVYISSVIEESRIVYDTSWGCPEDGEVAYTISGSCNPAFAELESYQRALVLFCEKLKEKLSQETVLLEIVPTDIYYFVGRRKA